jgi:hypothetical protein
MEGKLALAFGFGSESIEILESLKVCNLWLVIRNDKGNP